jgi:hypothetical protein
MFLILIFFLWYCQIVTICQPCLQALICFLLVDPVYWLGFHLHLLDLLCFSFPRFVFFFQNLYLLTEFPFHILHCVPYFIQLLICNLSLSLLITFIILLNSLSFHPLWYHEVSYCGMVNFWRSHVTSFFHISCISVLKFVARGQVVGWKF